MCERKDTQDGRGSQPNTFIAADNAEDFGEGFRVIREKEKPFSSASSEVVDEACAVACWCQYDDSEKDLCLVAMTNLADSGER